jgi:hypothetical protein
MLRSNNAWDLLIDPSFCHRSEIARRFWGFGNRCYLAKREIYYKNKLITEMICILKLGFGGSSMAKLKRESTYQTWMERMSGQVLTATINERGLAPAPYLALPCNATPRQAIPNRAQPCRTDLA